MCFYATITATWMQEIAFILSTKMQKGVISVQKRTKSGFKRQKNVQKARQIDTDFFHFFCYVSLRNKKKILEVIRASN